MSASGLSVVSLAPDEGGAAKLTLQVSTSELQRVTDALTVGTVQVALRADSDFLPYLPKDRLNDSNEEGQLEVHARRALAPGVRARQRALSR